MVLWAYRAINVLLNLIYAWRLYDADFHIMRVIFEPLFLVLGYEALYWIAKGFLHFRRTAGAFEARKAEERKARKEASQIDRDNS